MDRNIEIEVKNRRIIRRVLWIIVIIFFLSCSVFCFRKLLGSSIELRGIRTAIVERGNINGTLSASGIITPETEIVITSPLTTTIKGLSVTAGQQILKGDRLMLLNCEQLITSIDQENGHLQLLENKKKQLQLKLNRALIDLKTQRDIEAMNIEMYEFKYNQQEALFQNGLISKTQLKDAELALNITRREYQRYCENIENQQLAMEADLESIACEIRILQQKITSLNRAHDLAQAEAPIDGVVTWVHSEIGDTVNQGEVIARIADLRSFHIEGKISQLHADKVAIGKEVIVICQDIELKGSVSNVEPNVKDGLLSFSVALVEHSHPSLRAQSRCEIFIVTTQSRDILRVENGPFCRGSGMHEVFVIRGKQAFRTAITIGITNYEYVEIRSGLVEGDKIIISDMTEYNHRSKITLTNY